MADRSLRVGVDVGGTFTKAVAVDPATLAVIATSTVPTSHSAAQGVAAGIVQALEHLLRAPGVDRASIRTVAHSTTQAVNALLEGDVVQVGIVGMGAGADAANARRRTQVGDVPLSAGRKLHTHYAFLDTTQGLTQTEAQAAVERLVAAGAQAIVATEAFGVDDPSHERLVMDAAAALGVPATAGHEVSGAYGLEVRTLTAAINASILPKMLSTAGLVERCLRDAGVTAPLVVMRGDGGVMPISALRARPILTVLSGPAASLAGALLYGRVLDGIFLEVGGTSTNIAAIRSGQPAMKYVQVMDHPTALRSLDVRVQGVAGGSLVRLAGRKLVDVGPRSAHIAGLPYACFSTVTAPVELVLFSPRPGDPADYVAGRSADGRMVALTVTCAANVCGQVLANSYASGDPQAARLAFEPLGRALGCSAEEAARRMLDLAAVRPARAAQRLISEYKLDRQAVVIMAGGGGAGALAPAVARKLGAPLHLVEHAEVISSVGAALAMIREEVERTVSQPTADDLARLASEARRAALASGAVPDSLQVMTEFEADRGTLRAVAIGAVGLTAKDGQVIDEAEARRRAAVRLKAAPGDLILAATLQAQPETGLNGPTGPNLKSPISSARTPDPLRDPRRGKGVNLQSPITYRIFRRPASRFRLPWHRRPQVAVIDDHGVIRLEADQADILTGSPAEVQSALAKRLSVLANAGQMSLTPRVYLLTGRHLLDFSTLREPAQILSAVESALVDQSAEVVALVEEPGWL